MIPADQQDTLVPRIQAPPPDTLPAQVTPPPDFPDTQAEDTLTGSDTLAVPSPDTTDSAGGLTIPDTVRTDPPVRDTVPQSRPRTSNVPPPRAEEQEVTESDTAALFTDTLSKVILPPPSDSSAPLFRDFSTVTNYNNPYSGHSDSIPQVTFRPSMFEGHLLQPVNSGPLPREEGGGWVFLVLLASLGLFASVKWLHFRKIRYYITAAFAGRIYMQLVREETGILSPVTILLGLSSLMLWGTFIYQAGDFLNIWPDQQVSMILLSILAVMLSFFIVKLLLYIITGIVLSAMGPTTGFLFTHVFFFCLSGLLLLPVVLSYQYIDEIPRQWIITAGILLAAITFIFRSQRGFLMAQDYGGVSRFYLFLYFCALEIVPLVLMYKLILQRI